MPRPLLLFFLLFFAAACHSVADKTKSVINKAGQAVGEGSTQFVKGISSGIETTLNSQLILSDGLQQQGVIFTRFGVGNDSSSTSKNKLTVYMIFTKKFNGKMSAKVLDRDGREYGRTSKTVTMQADDAGYIDFVFDIRTDVESNSKFVIE